LVVGGSEHGPATQSSPKRADDRLIGIVDPPIAVASIDNDSVTRASGDDMRPAMRQTLPTLTQADLRRTLGCILTPPLTSDISAQHPVAERTLELFACGSTRNSATIDLTHGRALGRRSVNLCARMTGEPVMRSKPTSFRRGLAASVCLLDGAFNSDRASRVFRLRSVT
jgi:hypothetical protein